jgi:CheY-like chemotaxis protein
MMKVLIADDNADQVLTLSTLLEGEGFDVRSVSQAEQILPLTEAFRPHVCLLDIGMPRCDGYETAKRLREKFGSQATLIAVTAYATERDRVLARDAGFDLHIAKPFEAAELIDVLTRLDKARLAH